MTDERIEPQLERDALGMGQILFQSIAMASPGAALAFSLAVGVPFAGTALPLSVLIAMAACLLVAYALGQQAKHMPSAGSLFAYASRAFGPRGGFFVGWCVAIYMLFFAAATLTLFAVIIGDTLKSQLGWDIPSQLWITVGGLIVGFVAYRGVHFSASIAMVLGVLEVFVFVLLAAWILLKNGDNLSMTPLVPQVESGGMTGVLKGAVFGILAFTGFESAASLGEEGRNPKKTIPKAIIFATLGVGGFYFFTTYAWVIGTGTGSFVKVVTNDPNPWNSLAEQYWGVGWLVIFFALVNSVIAVALAGINSGSRILYAIARAEMLPSSLARISPLRKTPYTAIIFAVVTGLLMSIVTTTIWDAGTAFGVLATVLTIFAIVAYITTCIGSIFFYRRHVPQEFHLVKHGLIPVLGALAFVVVMYYQFFPAPSAPLIYANWFSLIVLVVLVVVTVVGHPRVLPLRGDEHAGFADSAAATDLPLQ